MNRTCASRLPLAALLALAANALPAATAAAPDPAAVRAHCSGCHRESSPGHFDRISDMRKSPEGWEMTLFRMHQVHGLNLEPAARSDILRYLSSVGGLAPAESAPGRFALERRPNVPDLALGEELGALCGRCHTLARASLQRRDAAEWLKLAHTHVGQWPTLEYQQSGRDRYWWESATTELPAKLGALYPLDTPAWRAWRARPHVDLAGRWLVFGHTPGRGDYHGVATISARAADEYAASYALGYAGGAALNGQSKAILYTGYEWRGRARLGDTEVREVFAASEDGTQLKGRWFQSEHAESGGDYLAVRAEGPAAVLACLPRALQAGTTQEVLLIGRHLSGVPDFGPGTHTTLVQPLPDGLLLKVAVEAGAASGPRTVRAGGARGADAAVIFDRIDRVAIEPAYAIARLGGGQLQAVTAQFEAIGYLDLPAERGRAATSVRLGALPASWSVAPHDAQAAAAQDVKFAGQMQPDGRFVPAGAGPNPARAFSGNNAGDLFAIATVKDGQRTLEGRAHLIVTVQRWNTPPIY